MQISLLASVLLTVGSPLQDPGPTHSDRLALYSKIRGATVKVYAEFEKWKRHGTGVAFKTFGRGDDGYTVIVTSAHVIRREGAVSKKVSVQPFKSKKKLSAYVMFEYLEPAAMYDLAFLVVKDEKGLIATTETVPDAERQTWTKGAVYACGHPGQEEFFIDDGKVTKVGNGRSPYVIEHDALVEHGNSGGGLFDEKGRLGAINTWLENGRAGMALDVAAFTKVFSIRSVLIDSRAPDWTAEGDGYSNGAKQEEYADGTHVFLLAIGTWKCAGDAMPVNGVGLFRPGPRIESQYNFGTLLVRLGTEVERTGRAHQGEKGTLVLYKDAAIGALKKGSGPLSFRINDTDVSDNAGIMRVIYLLMRPNGQATSNRFILSRISDTSSASR